MSKKAFPSVCICSYMLLYFKIVWADNIYGIHQCVYIGSKNILYFNNYK